VEGSFDNWTTRTPLQKSGNDYTIVKLLSPGVYQYKFIVDGEWQYDPSQPAMYDERNNVNNVIEVQEYAPENLDSLTVFDQPPSPDSSYGRPEAVPEDYLKEPPTTPAHLNLTLLNVPPALDAQAVLPRPLHVILNHAYVQREVEVRCQHDCGLIQSSCWSLSIFPVAHAGRSSPSLQRSWLHRDILLRELCAAAS
jgi:5'-AMP-activated protein kinase, regulatory beta subunit